MKAINDASKRIPIQWNEITFIGYFDEFPSKRFDLRNGQIRDLLIKKKKWFIWKEKLCENRWNQQVWNIYMICVHKM